MFRMLLSFILVTGLFLGCSKNESNQEKSLEKSAQSEKAALEKENPVGVYGKGITLTEQTLLSEIMASPEKFEGKLKTILTQGKEAEEINDRKKMSYVG